VQGEESHTPVIEMDVDSSTDDDVVDSTPLNERQLRERPRAGPSRFTPSDYPPGRQERARGPL
jgi:hypothetical protein